MKPTLKAPGTKRLKLKYDVPLSNFAFKFNLRRYSKAAESGRTGSALCLAQCMFGDKPHAREVGHVAEAAGVATSAGVMEGHDVPPEVMASVVHWLRRGQHNVLDELASIRGRVQEGLMNGFKCCYNDECEAAVVYLKDFQICPRCKTARYCGEACQRHDWHIGGHKETCGIVATKIML